MGDKDANRQNHAKNLLHEARQLHKHVLNEHTATQGKRANKLAIPASTSIPFLESLIEYFEASKGPDAAIWQAFARLEDANKAQHASTNATLQKLLSRGTNSSSSSGSRLQSGGQRSWSSVVSGGENSSPQSNVNSTSTATASKLNTTAAKEIRVIFSDKSITAEIRASPKPNELILTKANEAITKCLSHNHNSGKAQSTATNATPATVRWIESARLMNSGDIFLYAKDAAAVERIKHHQEEWKDFLGTPARIVSATYGVVISSIPIQTDVNNQSYIIEKVSEENPRIIDADTIHRIRWMNKVKTGKPINAMVIEFNTPEAANACICAERITFEGAPKRTQRYNKNCIICQCFNCYGYNHTARMCGAQTKCGFCGNTKHQTRDHNDPKDTKRHKCALCAGNHTAWAKDCKVRKAELAKVIEERKRLLREPLFQEMPNITPGASERTSRQSTQPGSPSAGYSILRRTPPQKDNEGNTSMVDVEEGEVEEPTLPDPKPIFQGLQKSTSASKRNPTHTRFSLTPEGGVEIASFSREVGKMLSFTSTPKTPIARRATAKAKNRMMASSPMGHTDTNILSSSRSGSKRAPQIHDLTLSSSMKKARLEEEGRIGEIREQIQMDIDTEESDIDQSSPPESLLAGASEGSSEVSSSAASSNSTPVVTRAKSKQHTTSKDLQ